MSFSWRRVGVKRGVDGAVRIVGLAGGRWGMALRRELSAGGVSKCGGGGGGVCLGLLRGDGRVRVAGGGDGRRSARIGRGCGRGRGWGGPSGGHELAAGGLRRRHSWRRLGRCERTEAGIRSCISEVGAWSGSFRCIGAAGVCPGRARLIASCRPPCPRQGGPRLGLGCAARQLIAAQVWQGSLLSGSNVPVPGILSCIVWI